jgi:hypothetical protein
VRSVVSSVGLRSFVLGKKLCVVMEQISCILVVIIVILIDTVGSRPVIIRSVISI